MNQENQPEKSQKESGQDSSEKTQSEQNLSRMETMIKLLEASGAVRGNRKGAFLMPLSKGQREAMQKSGDKSDSGKKD